jgi:hypothetical protein
MGAGRWGKLGICPLDFERKSKLKKGIHQILIKTIHLFRKKVRKFSGCPYWKKSRSRPYFYEVRLEINANETFKHM